MHLKNPIIVRLVTYQLRNTSAVSLVHVPFESKTSCVILDVIFVIFGINHIPESNSGVSSP